MGKQRNAKDVADFRPNASVWIDHARLSPEDSYWLADIERLTLWNVEAPAGFLALLPNLWWVDLRGGSARNLEALCGCEGLRFLDLNQIRGVTNLGLITAFTKLEMLHLYGLPRVEHLPSLSGLSSLERIEIGSMKGLKGLAGLLDAPSLRELWFVRSVSLALEDVEKLAQHPTLKAFGWFAEDVPDRTWVPVVRRIGLPEPRVLSPEEWFANRNQASADPRSP